MSSWPRKAWQGSRGKNNVHPLSNTERQVSLHWEVHRYKTGWFMCSLSPMLWSGENIIALVTCYVSCNASSDSDFHCWKGWSLDSYQTVWFDRGLWAYRGCFSGANLYPCHLYVYTGYTRCRICSQVPQKGISCKMLVPVATETFQHYLSSQLRETPNSSPSYVKGGLALINRD